MGETFEFRDLSGSEFWAVDLQRSTFRDVDLSGSRLSQSRLVDVEIDAQIDRLVVNGVDVTDIVNSGDPWFALRSRVFPIGLDGVAAWPMFTEAWNEAIERAGSLPDEARHASVNGQWSFVQTLRHLVFATDKWFTVPVVGGPYHPSGLPNTGSDGLDWPGRDRASAPTFDAAVATWRACARRLQDWIDALDDPAALDVIVDVVENGPHAVHDCVGVVFEEHFQHLRYAHRDLATLQPPNA